MPKKQNKSRYFLLQHKKCGSVFTIDANKQVGSYQKKIIDSKLQEKLQCPSCFEHIIDHHKLMVFFEKYLELIEVLGENGLSIREIKKQIDPEAPEL